MFETDRSSSFYFLSLNARCVLENLKTGLLKTSCSTSCSRGYDFKPRLMDEAGSSPFLVRQTPRQAAAVGTTGGGTRESPASLRRGQDPHASSIRPGIPKPS